MLEAQCTGNLQGLWKLSGLKGRWMEPSTGNSGEVLEQMQNVIRAEKQA